ncbi:flagellar hook-length control FliK family protein [Burkholderia thailandensis 34]|uniref:flagellar hook-length control protein FliK n=1 Tax=Burkholderia thailandensis TaxID=57975 RepID=UPI0005D91408|nr:flagellar hook-length control protein FliK [Burkholderia thailandensis]AJY33027.1 flagellar hook-length control FliK family protein [Burkholderia thailandensis 34]AOJ58795.1 flagellar hook-length control protein [Burkholderia thailandensis]KXF57914.1 flagellar hook-length control protein [Burkholderia thailandensis]PNE77337.1 flagellar hook-length control protein FliK [Burkholderia thailandensis]
MNALIMMTGLAAAASERIGAACSALLGGGAVRGRAAGASGDEAQTQDADSSPETDRLEDVSQSVAFAGVIAALEVQAPVRDVPPPADVSAKEGGDAARERVAATAADALTSGGAGRSPRDALGGLAFGQSPMIEAGKALYVSPVRDDERLRNGERFRDGERLRDGADGARAGMRDAASAAGAASTSRVGQPGAGAPRDQQALSQSPGQQAADKPPAGTPGPQDGTIGAPVDVPRAAARAHSPQSAPVRLGAELMSVLGERIDVQLQRGVERAVIRLDPQSMGTLHIAIRHEGGSVQIQMIASHEEVARQLQTMSEALRQDLSSRHHGDVTVVVRHGQGMEQGAGHGEGGAHREEKRPGAALAEADVPDGDDGFRLDGRDVI